MQTVDNDHVVAFDVDDTLIMWVWDNTERIKHSDKIIDLELNGFKTSVLPHEEHIELLKRYKTKGKTIIVWSQSGYEWAEAVVNALSLTRFVDFVFTKPEKYIDDLKADEWMEHVYKGNPNDKTPHN